MSKENETYTCFVNFTNHPSVRWEEGERLVAESYGEIVDIPFPEVNPKGDEAYVKILASEYVEKILEYHPTAVLCQGEFCLAYQVITQLKEKNIPVMAACSERMVVQNGNQKSVTFVFEQFRRY